jgi:hypothetical protein
MEFSTMVFLFRSSRRPAHQRSRTIRYVLYAADSGSGATTSNNRIEMFDGHFHSLGSFTYPNVTSQ